MRPILPLAGAARACACAMLAAIKIRLPRLPSNLAVNFLIGHNNLNASPRSDARDSRSTLRPRSCAADARRCGEG